MAKTKFNDFHGMAPVQDDRLLDRRFASCAIDADLRKGDIRPFPCPVEICEAAIVETIYPLDDCDCLTFSTRVRIIEDCGLHYQSSEDGLRISTEEQLCADQGCDWCLECPELAPAIIAADCENCDCETEPVSYFYTYIMQIGDKQFESHPSPATMPVLSCTPTNNQLSFQPSTNDCYTGIRVYRSVVGFKSGAESATQVNSGYMMIAELPAGTTELTDTTISGPLANPLLNDFGCPPADLKEIVKMDNGVIAGISGNSIYWTLPGLPMSFSDKRRRVIDKSFGNLQTLAIYDNELYVLTDCKVILYTYSITSNGLALNRNTTAYELPLSSIDSVAVGNQGVMFATPTGIAIIRNSQVAIISSSDFHGSDWESIDASTIHAVVMENSYIFSSSTNTFMVDFGDGLYVQNPRSRLVMLSFGGRFEAVTALYNSSKDGLRFAKDGKVYLWNRDAKKLGSLCDERYPGICDTTECCPYYWESSVEDLERALTYTAGMIEIDRRSGDDPVEFTLYEVRDNIRYKVAQKQVTSSKDFRLPGARRGEDMVFSVSSCTVIKDVTLATSRTALGE